MDPTDEVSTKTETTERELVGAAAGSDDQLEGQLRTAVKDVQRLQAKSAGDLHGSDDNLNEPAHEPREELLRSSPQRKPAEDMQKVLLRITSERKALYDRLSAIDSETRRLETQTKRRASRAFGRYLVAICIGVAATLAWQSYGEATKRIIATSAPEFGWSPEGKQTIASWVQQLGWATLARAPQADGESTSVRSSVPETPQVAPVVQTAPAMVAPTIAPSIDLEQVQLMTQSLATLQQTVEKVAASQDQMARVIARLGSAVEELNVKIPEPRPQPPAAAARKPARVPPQSSRPPIASSRAPMPPQQ